MIIAPEVLFRENHTFIVDFYALGSVLYELMMHRTPYKSITRDDLMNEMITKPLIFKRSEIPEGWSCEAADFISKVVNNYVLVFTKKTSK